MGKVQQGILDGFIGKVGTVVGAFWKGKPVMRAYKRQIHDLNSEAQQLVRTRFGAINALSGQFITAIRLGFNEVAQRERATEGNIFVHLNWNRVHSDTPGSATIDYEDLVVAQGNLPEVQFGAATFTNPLEVDVAINDDATIIGSDPADEAYVFVYSPQAKAGILSQPVLRVEESAEIRVPAYWNGHRVHLYGFAIGGGTDNQGLISNSRYLGSGTIS